MVDQVHVEKVARRRVLGVRFMGLLLLLMGIQDVGLHHGFPTFVGISRALGLLWIALIILFVLFAGGGLTRNPATRAALYDESTLDHRRQAHVLGFWVALVVCGAYWIATLSIPIGGAEVAHGVVTFSIAIAMLRFATLEMKAMKE